MNARKYMNFQHYAFFLLFRPFVSKKEKDRKLPTHFMSFSLRSKVMCVQYLNYVSRNVLKSLKAIFFIELGRNCVYNKTNKHNEHLDN